MTARTWVNGSGLALSAANMNSLETDVQKGLDAFTAVGAITLNSWQPSTVYAVNRYVIDPNGLTVKVTTAHTSTTSYDSSKFTAVAVGASDASIAGFIGSDGSATNTALSTAISAPTRTNLLEHPHGNRGWYTTSGYNSTYDATTQRRPGYGSRKYTRSGAGQYAPFGRGAGSNTYSTTGTAQLDGLTPVTPGLGYGAGLWMKSDVSTTNAYVQLRFIDAAGIATSATKGATAPITGGGGWVYFNVYAVAPANSVKVSLEHVLDTGTDPATQAPDGTRTWATDAFMAQRDNAPLSSEYFDGDTPATATTANRWEGVPENSRSIQRVFIAGTKPLTSRTGAPPVGQGEFHVDLANHLSPSRVIGTTDDGPAFAAALGRGSFGAVRVFVPAGEYWVNSAVLMPSYSELFGAGIDISIIRLLPTAANDTWVVTNSTPTSGGNVHIRVRDLTLDWKQSTQRPGGGGGTRSSCLTLRNVQYAWIDRVKVINAGLHGIDIAQGAIDYPYFANGTDGGAEPNDPSRYVWVRNCIATGWGDDGITTHHSEYLYLENNYCYDPRDRGNCNGIEIDDGSRHVFLTNNMSSGCYGGIEIKAHANANAASDVHIKGHISTNDVRSFNFRHIGHHTGTDPVSVTAYDITASNLVSITPNNDKAFQDEATPRSLVISAYSRVSINNITSVGRNGYTTSDAAIAIQFRASNISLTGVNITGWGGAEKDISVTSGDKISFSGVNISKSAARAFYVGTGPTAVQITNVNADGPTTGAMYGIDSLTAGAVEASGISFTGYPIAVRVANTDYATSAHFYRRAIDTPAGVTRLADLDPTKDYYASTSVFAAFTDLPFQAVGGHFIEHSRITGTSVIQTLTRNTSGSSQARYWRILDYVSKAVGAWNAPIIPVAGILAAGTNPPAGAPVGSVWLVRS